MSKAASLPPCLISSLSNTCPQVASRLQVDGFLGYGARELCRLAVSRDVVEAECFVRLVIAMKNLGREVKAVRPYDSSRICVDSNPREVLGIVEGRYEGARGLARDVVEVANDTVVEQDAHYVGAQYRDPDN